MIKHSARARDLAVHRSDPPCSVIQTALPQARSDGDRRSLYLLTKLNSRRGCGDKKADDCYACLRSQTKEIIATTNSNSDINCDVDARVRLISVMSRRVKSSNWPARR